MPPVLVYDGSCGYCSAVAHVASIGGMAIRPIDSEDGQRLLDVFDEPGFTLYLFDEKTVYWGSDAAEEVAHRLHVPHPLVDLIGNAYPRIVSVVSFLTRRSQEVEGPSCDCAVTVDETGSGGTMELDEMPDYPENSIE